MVPVAKLSSWYMLMLLSFVLITLINEVRIRAPGKSVGASDD